MSNDSTIPAVALGPDDAAERAEWLAALARVIDANAYCLGPMVAEFETQVAKTLGIRHAIGVANGSDAIRIGLYAIGVRAGDEVIVPAFTFFATASSVAHLGARPRFVDVDPGTLTMSPAAAAAAVNSHTKAIMPVHLYGQAACMDELLAIARARDIQVFEDTAQAFGVRYRGAQLGTLGIGGSYSFYPTKNLGAPGDAGMVVTQDDDFAKRVRSLRAHGDAGGYQHHDLGWNARLDGFQAAVLSARLARLDEIQHARRKNAERYLRLIRERKLETRLGPLARTEGSEHCWHQFVVRVKNRDQVRARLAERGIQTGVHYPSPLPAQAAFAYLGHRSGEFPNAEAAAREVLALPVHHRLKSGDVERVIDTLAEATQAG